MLLYPIEHLFFRRKRRLEGKIPDYYSYDIPPRVRRKVIFTFFDCRVKVEDPLSGEYYDDISVLYKYMLREFDTPLPDKLTAEVSVKSFLMMCSVEEFLSTIEIYVAIKYDRIRSIRGSWYDSDAEMERLKTFIDTVNKIFKLEKIGYEIVPVGLENMPYIVIPFNSRYLYLETIKKPRELLYNNNFKGPLNEFEEALDDYRKGRYSDSILKATKSYESTLKTILDLCKVKYTKKDNIPRLVEKVVNEANIIDSELKSTFHAFWAVLKNGPPTIRNKPGVAHGQGRGVSVIEKSYSEFVLRLTGTYIVFLIERYMEVKGKKRRITNLKIKKH